MAFKIASYLDRIGLAQVPTTLDDLLALQQAQMRAIPYENFDVLLGDNLTEKSIWAKLIDARRGGYCFELNKLFGLALEALDFTVRPFFAGCALGAPSACAICAHRAMSSAAPSPRCCAAPSSGAFARSFPERDQRSRPLSPTRLRKRFRKRQRSSAPA